MDGPHRGIRGGGQAPWPPTSSAYACFVILSFRHVCNHADKCYSKSHFSLKVVTGHPTALSAVLRTSVYGGQLSVPGGGPVKTSGQIERLELLR